MRNKNLNYAAKIYEKNQTKHSLGVTFLQRPKKSVTDFVTRLEKKEDQRVAFIQRKRVFRQIHWKVSP